MSRNSHLGVGLEQIGIGVYFAGKEIRRMKNEIAYSPSPIWLSMAIIAWAGKVTDAIDDTAMEVDYVRVYKRK